MQKAAVRDERNKKHQSSENKSRPLLSPKRTNCSLIKYWPRRCGNLDVVRCLPKTSLDCQQKICPPTFSISDGVISFSYGNFGLFQIFTFDVRQEKRRTPRFAALSSVRPSAEFNANVGTLNEFSDCTMMKQFTRR